MCAIRWTWESVRAVSEVMIIQHMVSLREKGWRTPEWNPEVNLLKEDVGNVLIWVKFHGVPMMAFSEGRLSVIATKLGIPLMLDSYTSDMCMQSCGRSNYARAMIELRADVKLKDTIMVAHYNKMNTSGRLNRP
ncbi:hypothetical protein Tco_1071201 [Tanacetum coccineum]|uniref:DUF4283 domain-containing protein n=1 Tax=Tanacetum coccineum TaxID=301880 RepID=A0ABQ5HNU9_9ASTR